MNVTKAREGSAVPYVASEEIEPPCVGCGGMPVVPCEEVCFRFTIIMFYN